MSGSWVRIVRRLFVPVAVCAAPFAAHATVCDDIAGPDLACDEGAWTVTLVEGVSLLDDYGDCSPFAQTAAEFVFPFVCPYDTTVDVLMLNTDCDFDLYVLGDDCDGDATCVGSDDAPGAGTGIQGLVTFDCVAGEVYHVVVEGWALDQGSCLGGFIQPYYGEALVGALCDERGAGCFDGLDNDLDGDVDCDDDGCICTERCDVPGDEDGNGLADCADPACTGAAACCDGDGDGVLRDDGACGGTDCDDGSAAVYPGAPEVTADGVDQDCDGVDRCFVDGDGDGFGGPVTAPGRGLICGDDLGEAAAADDCDDTGPLAAQRFPGNPEVPGDGIDQDCDAVDACHRDRDGDGFGAGPAVPGPSLDCDAAAGWSGDAEDCLDEGAGAASVYPGADEVCDGLDNDCNDAVDDVPDQLTVYLDADDDGYGLDGASQVVSGCDTPDGYGPLGGDCDDGDAARNPGAVEVPYDGVDQDCSGTDLVDVDGDGSAGPQGTGPDCHDGDPQVGPGRPERANGVDDDCDGTIDETTDQHDDDGDGYSEQGGDCDDVAADVHPGAAETADGVDQDCDGTADEGTTAYDDDGDGFAEVEGDCHDGDAGISPAAAEIDLNGVDDDCDGAVDAARVVDADGDGFARFGGDCDDDEAAVSPAATEVANGIDDDCDGVVDEGTRGYDDDGDGFSEDAGDCHDGDPRIHPGAPEFRNGYDDDCDGRVDDVGAFDDADGDGFTPVQGDCDDADPGVNPLAAEVVDGKDQDCDGLIDEYTSDLDGDGITAEDGDCDDLDGWVRPGLDEVCDGLDNDCDGDVDEGGVCSRSGGSYVQQVPNGCAQGSPVGGGWVLLCALAWRRRGRRGA